ncbi:FRG domain-containing protein [Priestia aryabhattai]|uniref:FRG domain-containing protein n=1 Tax=Priestia aryabhattai TaxID=412384 RepID=UPI002E1F15BA|nr:FRG domain-containing protein [Priestia aryabhattai]
MWKEIKIENWNHFNDIIFQLKPREWIFRGQSSIEWDIETSLYRECKKFLTEFSNINCLKAEVSMYNEFRSSYKLYSTNQVKESTDDSKMKEWVEERISFMSSMQHYGTPTRLLDWTYSPYVATFFALDGTTSDFCVYTLNSTLLKKHNKKRTNNNFFTKHRAFVEDSQTEPFVYPYEPFEQNERIRKQQGLFLVPNVINKTINEILESYGIEDGKLDGQEIAYKLIFSKDYIQEWWSRLKQMNITHETIYPGMEGFCKSLKLNIINPN